MAIIADNVLKAQYPALKLLTNAQYKIISAEIRSKFGMSSGGYGSDYGMGKVIPEQEFFEDVKIYIYKDRLAKDWKTRVVTYTKSKASHTDDSTNIFTFEYKDFPITVIPVEEGVSLDNVINFSAYGGIGEIYARQAEKMGMIFDVHGLRLPVYNDNKLLQEVTLCKYFMESLTVLGYPVGRHQSDFYSNSQICDFISNCKYFSKDMFEVDTNSTLAKTKVFQLVKTFLDKTTPVDNFNYASGKTPWLPFIKKSYPDEVNQIQFLIRNAELRDKLDKKLSADIILENTGISDKVSISEFKKFFENSFSQRSEFERFALSSSTESIRDRICEVFKDYTDSKLGKSILKPKDKVTTFFNYVFPRTSKIGDIIKVNKFSLYIKSIDYDYNTCVIEVKDGPAEYLSILKGTYKKMKLALKEPSIAPDSSKTGFMFISPPTP